MTLKRVVTMVMAFVMVFGMAVVPSNAAAKPAKVRLKYAVKDRLRHKVIIRWKKAKNAKKYQVFRRKAGGKWKRVLTTKKLKCKRDVAYNKTYYFKVRAINGTRRGAFSKVVKRKMSPPKVGEKLRIYLPTKSVLIENLDYYADNIFQGKTGNTKIGGSYENIHGKIIIEYFTMEKKGHSSGYAWEDFMTNGVRSYKAKMKKSGYQLAWRCDGTEPWKDQKNKRAKLPGIKPIIQTRGTVRYGDGWTTFPEMLNSGQLEDPYGEMDNINTWFKVYKGNNKVFESYYHEYKI